ncbi:DUF4184 family protein [Brevibacillus sp. TJ4]|uniref:DUF4184 family protein n=1 Tax=Brevibacillus sp. TJ4 TaxID=3234853 RepID=UPI0037D950A2
MPFTFAHPAIVLPLYRLRSFSFTALVCGSIAPDFEYFLRMQPYSVYSHTLAGVSYVDLPIAFLLAILFHRIVKLPLYACLPRLLQKAVYPAVAASWKLDTWRKRLVFAYSAVLGSLTHIVWDSFTHQGAFFVEKLPALQAKLNLGGLDVPLYKLLQHGSTILGLTAIGCFLLWTALRSADAPIRPGISLARKVVYWFGIGATGVLVACVHAWVNRGALPWDAPLQSIVPFLSGSMLGIILFSCVLGQPGVKK